MTNIKTGDQYGGGIVYYVDASGEHGLIASMEDLTGEADWDEAMEACRDYRGGGYNDWRLPTDEELNCLYEARDQVGEMVHFSYWSATEYAGHFAWFQHFYNGMRENDFKDNTCYVRAVRSF